MQTNKINLTGRVAVVTGGAQGIGLEVGRRLLESGARLVIWDVNPAGIEQARRALEEKAAELALSAGVVTQQERWEILTTNIAFIFVDFYRDIAVANHMRPRFWQSNRF